MNTQMNSLEFSNMIRKKLLEANKTYLEAMEEKFKKGDKDLNFLSLKNKHKTMMEECNKLMNEYEDYYLNN